MLSATRVSRFRPLGLLAVLALFAACDTAPGPSLYDPIEDGSYRAPRPNPSLTSISPPPGDALAGVSVLTLTGQNFAPSVDSTFVYFNGSRYPVLSVSPTEIQMRAPNLPQDGLRVRVSVLRAEHFSETHTYRLLPAVERLGEHGTTEAPVGMTTDADGNVYMSFLRDGAGGGIRKVTPDGVPTQYATATASTYPGLAYSEATGLLGVRNVRAVFRIAEGGTATGSTYFVFPNAQLRLRAIDIDASGNVWTGGGGVSSFYRLAPDQTVTEVPHPGGDVRAIIALDDYVYVSLSTVSGTTVDNRVYRFALTGGNIGPAEEVARISELYAGTEVTAFAATAGGDLFMGTARLGDGAANNPAPILELPAGGSLGELYDGLMVGSVVGLGYGPGTLLYAFGPKVVAIDASMATAGDLIQINTLREGRP